MKLPRRCHCLRLHQAIRSTTLALVLVACSQSPPSWTALITAKITDQYPAYIVKANADGGLVVERPGLASQPVDVSAIAKFCQRGPKDCDYAIDQLLLELRAPAARPP